IVVGPASANVLAFSTQPGSATIGAPFGIQPVVRAQDQFGNNSSAGLAASQIVTLALVSGAGPLTGTTNFDIGANAGNGIAAFTDLQIDVAGANYQLAASCPGLSNATSSIFAVGTVSFA